MAVREIARRYIDGAWRTREVDEDSGGGSLPSGGTTGQVLTKASNADGDADWEAPGGGSQPVSCVLFVDAASIDAHGGSPVYVTYDKIWDNVVDQNELEALPDGLGLSGFGTDTLTTTEAGVWAFSMGDLTFPPDATWAGDVNFGNLGGGGGPAFFSLSDVHASGSAREVSLSQVLSLPSGAGFSVGITPFAESTANPYNVTTGTLSIVRLA